MSCSKDSSQSENQNPQPDAEGPITEDSQEEDPESTVTEGVSEEDLVTIQIEIPANTTYTQFKVVDYQGREVVINETLKVEVDRNSEIRLVDRSTGNVVYIGYFNVNTSSNKGTSTSTCQDAILNSLSTARYLVAKRLSFGLSKYFTPTPNGPGTFLGNFYESGVACKVIDQKDVNNIAALIDNIFETTENTLEGTVDIATAVTDGTIQGALDVVTGGVQIAHN